MITFTRLGGHGQLGNQMFQYAMLMGVAGLHAYELRIPKHTSKKKKRGLYELDRFNVSASNLRKSDLDRISGSYTEKGFEFDPAVFEQEDGTDYSGYYQTEKYFTNVAAEVRKEFRFLEPIDEYAHNYVEGVRSHQSVVAVHVRRGDYLNRPDLFHVLSKRYYDQAKERLPGQYLVMSDDLDWCRKNSIGDVYVESPDHWHDLAIMTHCDAHIISASSFSWWGAWLANRDHVVAPTPWFPAWGPRGTYNMNDIIPERWETHPVK